MKAGSKLTKSKPSGLRVGSKYISVLSTRKVTMSDLSINCYDCDGASVAGTCYTGGGGSGPGRGGAACPRSRPRACSLTHQSTLSQHSPALPIIFTIGRSVGLFFTSLLITIYFSSLPRTLCPMLPVFARSGNLEAKPSKSLSRKS